MANIVVVFHSGYGHTQRVAQAVAESAGAQLLAIDADGNLPEGGWELLGAADMIVFGSPTYMGARQGPGRRLHGAAPAARGAAPGGRPLPVLRPLRPGGEEPGTRRHDVRPHPHIGLATVTYLFEGAMMHRDSLGTVQRIEPGAINWMTAGRGIVHSERKPERPGASLRQPRPAAVGRAAGRRTKKSSPAFRTRRPRPFPKLEHRRRATCAC
jgi:redox-sensitive bicupin YhaK (pirin superfamily)